MSQVHVRVDEDEVKAWRIAAIESGVTLQAMIREAVRAEVASRREVAPVAAEVREAVSSPIAPESTSTPVSTEPAVETRSCAHEGQVKGRLCRVCGEKVW